MENGFLLELLSPRWLQKSQFWPRFFVGFAAGSVNENINLISMPIFYRQFDCRIVPQVKASRFKLTHYRKP